MISPSQNHILVVDDDAAICQQYFKILTGCGYDVKLAQDGEHGWKVLRNMPKLSGVELIQKLRAARMVLPVIMASAAVPFIAESLQLAAILPKPFGPAQLVRTVEKVLSAAGQRPESSPPIQAILIQATNS